MFEDLPDIETEEALARFIRQNLITPPSNEIEGQDRACGVSKSITGMRFFRGMEIRTRKRRSRGNRWGRFVSILETSAPVSCDTRGGLISIE
jgi:hypothetical protein